MLLVGWCYHIWTLWPVLLGGSCYHNYLDPVARVHKRLMLSRLDPVASVIRWLEFSCLDPLASFGQQVRDRISLLDCYFWAMAFTQVGIALLILLCKATTESQLAGGLPIYVCSIRAASDADIVGRLCSFLFSCLELWYCWWCRQHAGFVPSLALSFRSIDRLICLRRRQLPACDGITIWCEKRYWWEIFSNCWAEWGGEL